MLEFIAGLLIVMRLLDCEFLQLGGFIHLLLVLAIVTVLIRVIRDEVYCNGPAIACARSEARRFKC